MIASNTTSPTIPTHVRRIVLEHSGAIHISYSLAPSDEPTEFIDNRNVIPVPVLPNAPVKENRHERRARAARERSKTKRGRR